MSTKLRDRDCPKTYGPHSLYTWGDGSVNLIARRDGTEVVATMDRAEFIKAVETELNVTVIDKPLPKTKVNAETKEVEVEGVGPFVALDYTDPNWLEKTGLDYLAAARALAEHRDAHPPVDEAQVEALTKVLHDVETDASDERIARALVSRGVRVEVEP